MKPHVTESGDDDSGWVVDDLLIATCLTTVLYAVQDSLSQIRKTWSDAPELKLAAEVTSVPATRVSISDLQELHGVKEYVATCIAQAREETLGTAENNSLPPLLKSPIITWVAYGRCIAEARRAIKTLDALANPLQRFMGKIIRSSGPSAAELKGIANNLNTILDIPRIRDSAQPYYWCADLAENIDLPQTFSDELPTHKNDDVKTLLSKTTGSQSDFLEGLVEVCGCNRKKREGKSPKECTPEILRDRRSYLDTVTGKLLGGTCSLGSDAVPRTPEGYADYRPTLDKSAASITVDAPPLLVTYDGSPKPRRVCKGVLRMPPISEAVRALDNWSHAPSHDGGRNDERLAHVTEWLRPMIKTAPTLSWKDHPDCLLLARLLCELCAPTDPSADRLAASQNVLGWCMINELSLSASDASDVRAVVSGIAAATPAQPMPLEPKAIRWPELAFITVGAFLPAGDCSASVLTAIEDVDWRLWLISTYAAHSDKVKVFPNDRDLLRRWVRNTDYANWEALKRELMACDRNPATLARAARHCTNALLKLARSPKVDEPWRPTFKGLEEDIHRLRQAILTRLHERDPERLGGLTPPRDRTGAIDVFTWRTGHAAEGDAVDRWTADWKKDDRPFGTMLSDEIRGDGTFRATFSTSSACGDDDLRLLSLPFVTILRRADASSFFKPGGPFDRFALAILSKEARGSGYPDITKAVETLRGHLAANDGPHFDTLVKAATSSSPDHPRAVAWLSALWDDRRFRFECHPAIDKAGDGFAIRPFTEKDSLAWEDSDACEGSTVRVVYSLDRSLSRRVLSRGRPEDGSAERLAAHLEQLCKEHLQAAYVSAKKIRGYLDRCRTFPAQRTRYMQGLMESVCAVLDELAARSPDPTTDPQGTHPFTEMFRLLSQIADCYGHAISPSQWTPHAGTPSTAFPPDAVLPVFFHPTVPAGNVIVDRFIVTGMYAREGTFRRSAGPALPGYERLRELEASLPPAHPRCLELRGELDDYPRHVLDGKFRLSVQGIYDRVWKAILEAPASAADHSAWKAALADLIRKPFDMVMFEPSSVGDYPVGWTVDVNGKAPFGRHIARVVRPGVRTLDKKLIWPAVVEMG